MKLVFNYHILINYYDFISVKFTFYDIDTVPYTLAFKVAPDLMVQVHQTSLRMNHYKVATKQYAFSTLK